MRRAILSTVAVALLGAVIGCKTHGVCDCDVHPLYEGPMPPSAGMPAPIHAPGSMMSPGPASPAAPLPK
jgi:hypothetical protein